MKKRKKQQKNSAPETRNLVAKHAHAFNKAVIFKDKSKYQRKAKHKSLEPFFMLCAQSIKKGFSFFFSSAHDINPTAY
ncbi:MAG: hypothetical protein GQ583_03280 [Methyloprofundus sp.]|nr:hypothetical protein [Methyloprofundus sp.]